MCNIQDMNLTGKELNIGNERKNIEMIWRKLTVHVCQRWYDLLWMNHPAEDLGYSAPIKTIIRSSEVKWNWKWTSTNSKQYFRQRYNKNQDRWLIDKGREKSYYDSKGYQCWRNHSNCHARLGWAKPKHQ